MRALALSPVALLVVVTSAMAADAASTVYDFTPIIQAIIAVAAPIIATLVGAVIWKLIGWLSAKTGIQISEDNKATIDRVLQRGIALGLAKTHDGVAQLGSGGKLTLDTHNAVVATALGYAADHAPDALKAFGIDLNSAALVDMIEARIGLLQLSQATTPTTPGAAMSTVPTPAPQG